PARCRSKGKMAGESTGVRLPRKRRGARRESERVHRALIHREEKQRPEKKAVGEYRVRRASAQYAVHGAGARTERPMNSAAVPLLLVLGERASHQRRRF